jgi:hypothetical protein
LNESIANHKISDEIPTLKPAFSYNNAGGGLSHVTTKNYLLPNEETLGANAVRQLKDFTTVYLSDLTPTSASNGYGLYEKDRSNGESGSNDGNPITLDGAAYAKGLGVHAGSTLVYNLGGNYTRFQADVGVDDEVVGIWNGSIVFNVYADGVLKYTSDVKRSHTPTSYIDVDVTGVSSLTLEVTCSDDGCSYDHGDWADAKLTTEAPIAVPVYLSDLTPAINSSPIYKDEWDNWPMTLNGVLYQKGLAVHPYDDPNVVIYNLNGQYQSFQTDIGAEYNTIAQNSYCNSNGIKGSVQFQVFVDGVEVRTSAVMSADMPRVTWNVPVTNANQLVLKVTNGGDGYTCDSSNWADAKLIPVPTIPNLNLKIVPFPIESFDTREGLIRGYISADDLYPGTVPLAGAMSLIDVDVNNLRRFANGEFDGKFPNGLTSAAIQKENGGYILYISDRRGDADDDGEYDMENVIVDMDDPNGNNAGNTAAQPGEDANNNGIIEQDYTWESTRYVEGSDLNGITWLRGIDPDKDIVNPRDALNILVNKSIATVNTDLAALFDHKHFRRGVRLINGTVLPTGGFTLATENGAYLKGNYNSTGIQGGHNLEPTAPADYLGVHHPASVAADAVTGLSNNWTDGNAFYSPFLATDKRRKATETTYRTAILAGDTPTTQNSWSANDGGEHLNGGFHDGFIRLIEDWSGDSVSATYMNHTGSFAKLFTSRNINGTWIGPDGRVFHAPAINRSFDTDFLDPTKIPPGAPFFEYIQIRAFRRNNE